MSKHIISPPVARSTDPITSDFAGENEKARADARSAVQRILEDGQPMSDWHIFQRYQKAEMGKLTHQRLRTARKELQDMGLVEPRGFQYGASENNGKAMTWAWIQDAVAVVGAELDRVDRQDQRRSRVVLGRVVGGFLAPESLELVATVARGRRKSLRDVTITDLVQMGLIEVRGSKEKVA